MVLITWKDGLRNGPDGYCRQVPTKQEPWASTLWITKDGTARRRYFDILSQKSRWAETTAPLVLSESGHEGYITDHFLNIETCICLAWRTRIPGSPTRVIVDGPPDFDSFSWEEEEGKEDEREIRGEKWTKLAWRIGAVTCDPSYRISSFGRLMNKDGDVTAGYWFDDRRWAGVKGSGLVDLTTAAKLRPNIIYLTPSIKQAADCIVNGKSPSELADAAYISINTAWTYFWSAAQHAPPSILSRVAPRILCLDMWELLQDMAEEGNPLMGGRLNDLKEFVEDTLDDGDFSNSEDKYGQLHFARLCLSKFREEG